MIRTVNKQTNKQTKETNEAATTAKKKKKKEKKKMRDKKICKVITGSAVYLFLINNQFLTFAPKIV